MRLTLTSSRISTLARTRLWWVLWLALLLPLAQAAANWHAQSHWDTERTSQSNGKHALAGDRCDLCLTAAGLTGGTATSTPFALPERPPRQAVPVFRQAGALFAHLSLAYRSRAPPFVPR
jgi:hypothetical protein